MLAHATGAVLTGIESRLVDVECDIHQGLPAFTIVGLPDTSCSEARERVRAALAHSDEPYPMQRITVNLAPSDLRKQGPGLDLAVALALLGAQSRIAPQALDGRLLLGELGLSGEVRAVRGALSAAEAARTRGLREVVCPQANAAEAALAGLPVLPVATLRDAVALARGRPRAPVTADAASLFDGAPPADIDLAQIRDQQTAKRALEVAAAGGHNLLLTGPPGTGKTLLARVLPGVLPRLTVREALEVTRIHSAAGLLPAGEALVRRRPFRAPHHGISTAGMVGGGSGFGRPGEISLAHCGVLFLDELPEFPRSCLEALRQPLEDAVITVVRSAAAVTFPARFMLVAAMNPCPCGNAASERPCRCTPMQREGYTRKLSGPLLDRIDMHVTVPRVDADRLLESDDAEPSSSVRERVETARAAARARTGGSNAQIRPGMLLRTCALDPGATSVLSRTASRYRLSARTVHRLLRVARTIADLAGHDRVREEHILEATGYRAPEVRTMEQAS